MPEVALPVGSVVTQEMVQIAADFYGQNTPELLPAVAGHLLNLEQGRGEMDADLFDAPSRRPVFEPLHKAYSLRSSQGSIQLLPYSNVPDYATKADYEKAKAAPAPEAPAEEPAQEAAPEAAAEEPAAPEVPTEPQA